MAAAMTNNTEILIDSPFVKVLQVTEHEHKSIIKYECSILSKNDYHYVSFIHAMAMHVLPVVILEMPHLV